MATPRAPGVDRASASSVDLDPEVDGLYERTRERRSTPLARTERVASLVVGGSFLAVAVPLALLHGSSRSPSPWTVLLLLAVYAVASQVEFEVGAGSGVPTELVLVPMLFVLPASWVPLAVAAGLGLGELAAGGRQAHHLGRIAVLPANAWHAVGPALVLVAAGEPDPAWHDWPILVAALAAQFALDYASSAAREWIAFRLRPRLHLRFMVWVWTLDAALAPIGFAVAMAAVGTSAAVLLVLPLIGLLGVFARQRQVGIDRALELGHAYRGTAFLLGDVVEADDHYTGTHCRDVVELVLAVADELRVDARSRRDAEFVALLHDVGKIRIPKELINKPGALTPAERAVIETHAAEGETMLAQVGGLLGEVGKIVRSHHERFDGTGYPDGLAGEEIPLIARIVACCDAFNAMTTDRPYRKALPVETAAAELRAQAGRQFDRVVVDALIGVVQGRTWPYVCVTIPPQGSAGTAGYPLPSLEMRRTWDALAAGETAVYVGDPATGASELAGLFGRLGGDPRSGICVEVGCGPGRMTGALADRFDQVVAVDVSPAMLEQARAAVNAPNVRFVAVSGERLDGIEDGTADTLVCYLVLQHLPAREVIAGYLSEFARVLSPGGEAYVQVPVLGRVGRLWRGVRGPLVARGRRPETGAAFRGFRLTGPELDRALAAAGLEVAAEDDGPSAYRFSRDRFLRLTSSQPG